MGLAIGNEYNYLKHLTNTSNTKNYSVTALEESSTTSTAKKSSPHLNEGTVKFVMENGMAESVEVDGINVSLADMFLTNKNQLKERINEKYNKTDAEKLEEIFNL